MSKKKIPKELKENQIVMMTKKELDTLKLQSSFFVNYYKMKAQIIRELSSICEDTNTAAKIYSSIINLCSNNYLKLCATIGEDEKE